MKKVLLVIPLLLLVSCAVPVPEGDNVCFGRHCFEVEVAKTPQERAYGLMFREQLDEDKGMLFMFEEETVHLFWMKNTLIPLDIVFINPEFIVIKVSQADPEPGVPDDQLTRYPSGGEVRYVVEMDQGLAEDFDIVPGAGVMIWEYYP